MSPTSKSSARFSSRKSRYSAGSPNTPFTSSAETVVTISTSQGARAGATLLLGVVLVCAAPLAGLALAHRPLAPFLAFPPRTAYVPHAGFHWLAWVLFSLPAFAAIAAFAWALRHA
ncbi:MAG TPA: hypothetical protein VE935_10440, partial [Burkholderiales bacterium]|nr:hypothetical protein [Burkholderiales bacterium]